MEIMNKKIKKTDRYAGRFQYLKTKPISKYLYARPGCLDIIV